MFSPPPGSVGLTRACGPARLLTTIGETLLGDRVPYAHAFIAVDAATVMEAWPGGVRWADPAEFADEPVAYGIPALPPQVAAAVVDAAKSLDGVGYRLRDYVWLAAYRRGLRPGWITARCADSEHLLPGQFVAEVFARAGVPLADREPWEVTLSDLLAVFVRADREWELRIPVPSRAGRRRTRRIRRWRCTLRNSLPVDAE